MLFDDRIFFTPYRSYDELAVSL